MPEVSDAVKVSSSYTEDENFVPNPTDAFGTLDTSATAGKADHGVEAVTPVFEVVAAQERIQAARALDPEDTEVPASLVVLPGDMVTREEAIETVKKAAEAAASDPVEIGGLNPFQKEAAEATGEEGNKVAEEQSEQMGAGSASTGTDTARQQGGGGDAPAKTQAKQPAK